MQRGPARSRWAFAAALSALASGCFLDSGAYEAGGAGAAGPGSGTISGATASGGGASVSSGGTATAGAGGTGGSGAGGATDVCDCKGCATGTVCAKCGPDDKGLVYQDPESGHCYAFMDAARWSDGQAECASWGGDLVGVSTQAELDVLWASGVMAVFADPSDDEARCWTGGNDRVSEGVWQWSNGEPWLEEPDGPSWSGGEPNGGTDSNCAVIGPGGTIRDRDCGESMNYLCERN